MKWIRTFLSDPIGAIVAPGTSYFLGAIAGIAGSAIGALKGNKAPGMAAPVDVEKVAGDAIAGNLANFEENSKLSAKTNTFDQKEALRLMEMAIPGFSNIQSQLTSMINQDLESARTGQMPAEVQNEILRNAAGLNLATGAQGASGDFNVARNLGLGALDYQNMVRQRALNTLGQVTGQAAKINPMSTRAMMVTPTQALQTAENNRQAQQAHLNAQAAASNAKWKGIGGLVSGAGGMLGGMFGGGGGLGGMLGGGGGGTSGGGPMISAQGVNVQPISNSSFLDPNYKPFG